MNLIDVTKECATEEQCFAYLEKSRWPDGVIRCTVCGNDKLTRYMKKGKTGKSRPTFQCLEPTCKNQFTVTSGTIFQDSHVHTNTIENFWSLFKRGLIGSFHQVSTKHLPRYLNEFTYRHNRRKESDLFGTTVGSLLNGTALQYRVLTANDENAGE